jgi:hypothetical protein
MLDDLFESTIGEKIYEIFYIPIFHITTPRTWLSVSTSSTSMKKVVIVFPFNHIYHFSQMSYLAHHSLHASHVYYIGRSVLTSVETASIYRTRLSKYFSILSAPLLVKRRLMYWVWVYIERNNIGCEWGRISIIDPFEISTAVLPEPSFGRFNVVVHMLKVDERCIATLSFLHIFPRPDTVPCFHRYWELVTATSAYLPRLPLTRTDTIAFTWSNGSLGRILLVIIALVSRNGNTLSSKVRNTSNGICCKGDPCPHLEWWAHNAATAECISQ